jgi:hypothetical protein
VRPRRPSVSALERSPSACAGAVGRARSCACGLQSSASRRCGSCAAGPPMDLAQWRLSLFFYFFDLIQILAKFKILYRIDLKSE